jgi:hypothetical protein
MSLATMPQTGSMNNPGSSGAGVPVLASLIMSSSADSPATRPKTPYPPSGTPMTWTSTHGSR